MASSKAGQPLTQAELDEMLAYDELGAARPDKFDDVVFDATSIRGAVWRWKTDEERKAGDEAAAAARDAADRREAALRKARKEIADRPLSGQTVGVRVPVADAGDVTVGADAQTPTGGAVRSR